MGLVLKDRVEGLTKFTHDMTSLSVEQQLVALDTLQQLVYKGHREMTPMYPLVLVLVLSKEQTRMTALPPKDSGLVAGIVLPESKQNKPMHEGIVLATWNEKVVERGTINKDGERMTRCEVLRSELKPGDHVLFHHWAGMPIHGFDDQRFRMVRECEWHETQQGGIVGVLHYSERENEPLTALLEQYQGEWNSELGEFASPLSLAKLRDRYLVIDKETQAVTLSGR
jgi:co-chaperonin GroES (HSP10)